MRFPSCRSARPAAESLLTGPERIEAGWWDGPAATINRDYFVARYARTRAGFTRQVEAAQHEAGEAGNGTLRGIHAAAGRLGHLVEQLLALAPSVPA